MNSIGICLTGHRPDKLYGYNDYNSYLKNKDNNNYKKLEDLLYKNIENIIDKFDCFNLSCGLALGADTCWGYAILRLKQKYPDKIRLISHIPNWDHALGWKDWKYQEVWEHFIDNSDEVICVDPDKKVSFAGALNMRNHTMVNMSEVIFGISNGDDKGGTANCLKYAKKKNISIHIWNPINFKKVK